MYQRRTSELSRADWERVFKSLGHSVHWFTFSGGEPFLCEDIAEIVESAYDHCHPKVINIPTNGILHNIIPEQVRAISEHCQDAQIIVNFSIDEIGEKHNELRRAKNNYTLALLALEKTRRLNCPNLTIGIHTVISRFNCTRIPEIYKTIQTLGPDSYVTEIAEERVELKTIGTDIAPSVDDYIKAIDYLSEKIKEQKFRGITRITQAFRLEYYELVKQGLREHRQIVPCFAGFASAQIAPDGDVWMCCTKAESIGSLRDVDYDFKRVWFSEKAELLRRSIRRGECYCPLANAAYTSILLDPKTLCKVAFNLLRYQN